MGKMIGGPLDGTKPDQSMITLQCRYNQISLSKTSRMPTAIYERIRKSDDFQWIVTIQDEEELRLWNAAHPNEWSYH